MVNVLVHDKHALPVTLGQQRLEQGLCAERMAL